MIRTQRGFALLDLIFVCGVIGVLSSIALPRLTLAKSAAGAASAIASMRAIHSAELTFALTCGNGFYAPNLVTLGTVPPGSHEAFIGGGLGASNAVTKSGYIIQVGGASFDGAPGTCNGLAAGAAAQGYRAAADPTDPQNPRHFAINVNGTIFESTSSMWSTMGEIGEPPGGQPLVR